MSFVHQTIEQTDEEIINETCRIFRSCLIDFTSGMKTPLCDDENFMCEMIELFLANGVRPRLSSLLKFHVLFLPAVLVQNMLI